MINKNKILAEVFFLLLVAGFLLWTGIAGIWGHKIQHDFPQGYFATDAFQHQTRAQWIKDADNYKYEGFYYSSNFSDIIGFYPPILNHAAVLLSISSGLEVYDTVQIVIFLAAVFGMLTVYILIRDVNIKIAILSIPLTITLFSIQGARVGWLWGHWPSLIGNFFLVVFAWALFKTDLKNSWILIGLFLSATALGHTVFTVFAILLSAIYISYVYWQRGKEQFLKDTKTLLLSGVLFLLTSAYFLNIFYQTWMQMQPYQFSIMTDAQGFGEIVKLSNFGYLLPVLIIGMLLGFVMQKKENGRIALFGYCIFLFGLMNYVGFERRAFNLRFFWPITLSVFFGITLYYVLIKIKRDLTIIQTTAISTIVAIIILASLSGQYISHESAGILNPPLWDTLQWLQKNTPENSKIFYSYGDFYDQFAFVANTKRNAVRMQTQDFVDSLKKGIIKRNYHAWLYSEYGAGLPYKTSLLTYGRRSRENPDLTSDIETDLCSMNYYVFDKISRVPELAQYNSAISKRLLNLPQFEIMHQNELSIILKNKEPGVECIV